VTVTIRKGGEVLFKKGLSRAQGQEGRGVQPEAPEQGGYLVRVNPARLDYVEIAGALLVFQGQDDLNVALGSKSKYIHAAAAALSDSWRGGGAPKIEPEHQEASDDD
jgi:hypothetical protein